MCLDLREVLTEDGRKITNFLAILLLFVDELINIVEKLTYVVFLFDFSMPTIQREQFTSENDLNDIVFKDMLSSPFRLKRLCNEA
jgi:hypothetical protein